jgi:SET domain-containing protein
MKLVIKRNFKGRGVYASESIRKGMVIEVCELLFIKKTELPHSLECYVYDYSTGKVALALGYGSLFNHSDDPNAEFFFNEGKIHLIIKAIKKIPANQEITINYGYDDVLKRRFKLR